MAQVIGVKFKNTLKTYYFSPANAHEEYPEKSGVMVETAKGLEYGTVVFGKKEVADSEIVHPLKPIIRRATEEDEKKIKENEKAVAMARSSRENEKFVAVNGVYTLPEHRNKGYASAIVACISDLILQNEKTPALYTDLSNPSSNTAYKNIGFTEQAPIDQVYLDWSK